MNAQNMSGVPTVYSVGWTEKIKTELRRAYFLKSKAVGELWGQLEVVGSINILELFVIGQKLLPYRRDNVIVDFLDYRVWLAQQVPLVLISSILHHFAEVIRLLRPLVKCQLLVWKQVAHEVHVVHLAVGVSQRIYQFKILVDLISLQIIEFCCR